MKNNLITFLNENPVQYMATIGLDGRPKVRPFQFMIEEEKKLYFCTSNQKNVFEEMKGNPYVELCVSNPQFAWIRLSGRVEFVSDPNIKERILENSDFVRSIYKAADNPTFEIFYIAEAVAIYSDFSGGPPKEFEI